MSNQDLGLIAAIDQTDASYRALVANLMPDRHQLAAHVDAVQLDPAIRMLCFFALGVLNMEATKSAAIAINW